MKRAERYATPPRVHGLRLRLLIPGIQGDGWLRLLIPDIQGDGWLRLLIPGIQGNGLLRLLFLHPGDGFAPPAIPPHPGRWPQWWGAGASPEQWRAWLAPRIAMRGSVGGFGRRFVVLLARRARMLTKNRAPVAAGPQVRRPGGASARTRPRSPSSHWGTTSNPHAAVYRVMLPLRPLGNDFQPSRGRVSGDAPPPAPGERLPTLTRPCIG
jgi:hypothetical protein